MTTGDALGFDFNREVHRIETNKGKANTEPRIVLKIHYVVYPKALPWYGRLYAWLNVTYDVWARKAFLQTLKPSNVFEKVFARLIIFATVYRYLELFVGNMNIVYLSIMAFLGLNADPRFWLYGTSFVHYFMYMGTYYHRDRVSFRCFKRDVMLYKTLAHMSLWYIYLTHFQFSLLSLALLAAGNALAMLSAKALGVDRTYFGVELGLLQPLRITAFPYNVPLPHPMIVGGIIGLLGFQCMETFRASHPFLALVHIALYVLHMLQEHLDVHANSKPSILVVPRILVNVAA